MKVLQQINEAKKIIHQEKGDVFSAKVYRDPENNEYQVHFFKQGKHMGEGPVSYHDNKEDAIGTAKASLRYMHTNIKEEAKKPVRAPRIHHLTNLTGNRLYDRTQTDDKIRDGDVIHSKHGVGIMHEAWPVHHSGNEPAFHHLKPGYSHETFENGRYAASARLANSIAMKDKRGRMIGPKGKLPEETVLKSFSKFITEAKALHPYALHVSDAGQGKYKVHAVGSELADGIKVGEHLTDTHLDDAAEMGAKIKHIKEEIEQIDEVQEAEMHPHADMVLKHIKPEVRHLYKPYLKRDVFKGKYAERAAIFHAAERDGHMVSQEEDHPHAERILKHIKPEAHHVYRPYLKKGVYKGNYADRAAILDAAERSGHIKD